MQFPNYSNARDFPPIAGVDFAQCHLSNTSQYVGDDGIVLVAAQSLLGVLTSPIPLVQALVPIKTSLMPLKLTILDGSLCSMAKTPFSSIDVRRSIIQCPIDGAFLLQRIGSTIYISLGLY